MATIFVDFSDEPAKLTAQAYYDSFVPQGLQIMEDLSHGRVDFSVNGPHGWFRMPKPASAYTYYRGMSGDDHRAFIEDAVRAADPYVDFSQTQAFIIVMPPTGKIEGYAVSPAFVGDQSFGVIADDNVLMNGTTIGTDWQYMRPVVVAHEILHTMRLVDLYKMQPTLPEQQDAWEYVGHYSMMSNYDAITPELFAWERWVLDWIGDSQVACLGSGTNQVALDSVTLSSKGTKAAVVPLGGTRFLALESRTRRGVDTASPEGILPYVVDPAIGTGEGPIRVPRDRSGDIMKPLTVGETLVVEGVGVEVLSRTGNSYTIKVHSPAPSPVIPGPVSGARAQALLSSLAVTWRAPLHTGWTDITGYEYRVGSGPWTRTSDTRVTLKGAKRGQRITVQVRAINSVGAGPITRITTRVT
ncbi:MAG: hypothetical protein B7C55_06225 [Actinomycetales bacterium mxb001]|nr:MAG: hypothetical protein B7C55_06225 [Actinomycetales bacterium mxb001]